MIEAKDLACYVTNSYIDNLDSESKSYITSNVENFTINYIKIYEKVLNQIYRIEHEEKKFNEESENKKQIK